MNSLSGHIEYLIRRNDCVIVPGWGAFVANYQPAHISADNCSILPPSRSIGFNPALTHNDGLIASSIVRQAGVSYDNAVETISREVNTIRHQLEHDGEIAIGRLGIFRKNDEGTSTFEPYATADNQFYGLRAIEVTPLLTSGHSSENGKVTDSVSTRRDVFYLPISRNIFKAVASLALLIGLGITLSTPILKDDNSLYAGVATIATTTTLQPKVIDTPRQADAELFISIPDIDETTSIVSTDNSSDIRLNDTDRYCLIIASHATRAQAEKQIAGDPDLRILESGKRFRVYAATGNTIDEARLPMQSPDFAQKYPDAWVCRR